MTYFLGLLIFGNILDNVSQPRWVALFAQIFLGTIWIGTGLKVNIIIEAFDLGGHIDANIREGIIESFFSDLKCTHFIASGVVLISLLQISNWFTQKHINKMMALFLLT